MQINSLTNARVKAWNKLKTRRARDREGLAIVEGRAEFIRAVESGLAIETCYLCPELVNKSEEMDSLQVLLEKYGLSPIEVSVNVYEKMAYGDRADGIAAVFHPETQTLDKISLPDKALVVVLDQVEKPGNLGAVMRTCDAAGVDALIVGDPATDLYNPNVIRASLGTVFTLKVAATEADEAQDFLKKNKIRIMAAHPGASDKYAKQNLTSSIAFVAGSEHDGLSTSWLKAADQKISLPMRGSVDSLNVSVTVGILVYEAVRQRTLS